MEKMLLRCAWSADGKMVTGGSGDSFVYVWNAATAELTYKLPGHSGSVNEVRLAAFDTQQEHFGLTSTLMFVC